MTTAGAEPEGALAASQNHLYRTVGHNCRMTSLDREAEQGMHHPWRDHKAENEGCVFHKQVADGIWSSLLLMRSDAITGQTVPFLRKVSLLFLELGTTMENYKFMDTISAIPTEWWIYTEK